MPSNSREPDMLSKSSPQQTKKTSMETHNEPSGSTTRSALHRRKSSLNLQKTQSIAIKSEPKPSRSQGESSAKRKEQNRIAQRAFRKRQKAHLEELEAEVIEKGMRIREITENNGLLLETMKRLQNQNVELKSSRAPNMPRSSSQSYMNPTGTPLTTAQSISHSLPESRHPPRRATALRSENGWSSSTDSLDSNISSPENTSPQALPSTSLGSDSAIGFLTGLQVTMTPSAVPAPQSPQGGSGLQQGFVGGASTMTGQMYPQFPNPQQRAMWDSSQASQRSSYINIGGSSTAAQHSASSQNMPLASRPPNGPGPMARRYSDAITRHHKQSMSDSHGLDAGHRPHTSISIGHPNTGHPYHRHSNSVPNGALRMSNGSPQMVFTSGFEPSVMQAKSFPGMATPEQILLVQPGHQPHVMYQQPAAYSSSSSSNVGWAVSPISHSASFTSVDQSAGDHSASSASYFSTLSLQPSTCSAMASDKLESQMGPQAIASGSLSNHWTDMMPSMGIPTPLQELPDGRAGNSVASNPAAMDLQDQRQLNFNSPFLPETGVFNMNSMDMVPDLAFSPFNTGHILESPAE